MPTPITLWTDNNHNKGVTNPVMTLWTHERQGEISPSCLPNISGVFLPALVEELQKHDPHFVASEHTTRAYRHFVEEDGYIPVAGHMKANLVLVIGVPGNRKLAANKDSIERSVESMLSGVLYPRDGIHVVLITQ